MKSWIPILIVLLSGCYYGPGLNRIESNAIRRSARDLNPYPVVIERSNTLGQSIIGGALDSTLTPLIFSEEELDPDGMRARDFDENMRRQEEAMRAMDREIEEIDNRREERRLGVPVPRIP